MIENMAKNTSTTRVRRSDEQLIADLQAKIAHLKNRAEQKKAKSDPALRHISAALRSLDKAEKETKDPTTRQALEDARATLSACLSLNRAAPKGEDGMLVPRARRAAKTVDPTTLLEHVRKNPGQRGEQIAAALGIDTGAMRPVMHDLIAEKKVKTKGQRRGMSYHPA
jgi:hypothetical protein